MEVSSTNLKAMDASLPINGELSRAATQPTQEELNEEESRKTLAPSNDAVSISHVGRTLAAGMLENHEDAMDLLGMTVKGIMNNRDFALGAHTGLDAYRAVALLDGLDLGLGAVSK